MGTCHPIGILLEMSDMLQTESQLSIDTTTRTIKDGLGRGHLEYRICRGGVAEICDIAVRYQHRRQGIARTMLGMMIAAVRRECKTVYAFTRESNAVGREWYAMMGFDLTRVPGFYHADNEDAYCCVKVLR